MERAAFKKIVAVREALDLELEWFISWGWRWQHDQLVGSRDFHFILFLSSQKVASRHTAFERNHPVYCVRLGARDAHICSVLDLSAIRWYISIIHKGPDKSEVRNLPNSTGVSRSCHMFGITLKVHCCKILYRKLFLTMNVRKEDELYFKQGGMQ